MSVRIVTALTILGLGTLQAGSAQAGKERNMQSVRVRYMVNNIDQAVSFYTKYLAFQEKPGATPNFAIVSRGNLNLVLSTPFWTGRGGQTDARWP